MRALGIDPGIERTGFAVMEMQNGKLRLLDCGRITTDKRHPFSHRLSLIARDLKQLLKQWKPDAAGIEQVFFSKNVKTAIKVAHSRGVILEILEERGVKIFEFNPSHVKLALTGDTKADKLQIQKMVQCLLGVKLKHDDAADAIACAVTLLTTNQFLCRAKNTSCGDCKRSP